MYKKLVGLNDKYSISNQGVLINNKTGYVIKPILDKYGYNRVSIYVNGKKKFYYSHRLVAIYFIPNPENKPQVNHLNRIRTDNRLENLEWTTCKENIRHSFIAGRKGFSLKGEKAVNSILKHSDIVVIKKMIADGYKISEIAKKYPVSYSTIYSIKSGKNWKQP